MKRRMAKRGQCFAKFIFTFYPPLSRLSPSRHRRHSKSVGLVCTCLPLCQKRVGTAQKRRRNRILCAAKIAFRAAERRSGGVAFIECHSRRLAAFRLTEPFDCQFRYRWPIRSLRRRRCSEIRFTAITLPRNLNVSISRCRGREAAMRTEATHYLPQSAG